MLSSVAWFTDPETVGAYGLALGVVTLVYRCFEFGMGQAANVDHNRAALDSEYYSLRVLFTSTGFLVCVGIALLYYQGSFSGLLILSLAVPKGIEAYSVLIYAFQRRANKTHYMAQSLILRGVSGVLAFACVLYFSRSLVVALLALALVWLMIAVCFDRIRDQSDITGSRFRVLVSFARGVALRDEYFDKAIVLTIKLLPLAVAGAAAYATGVVPRILLDGTHGMAVIGVFTVLFYPMQAGNMVFSAVESATLGPLSASLQKKDWVQSMSIFIRLIAFVSTFCALGVVFVYFLGGWALNVFYGPDYSGYKGAFFLLAIAWVPRYLGSSIKCIAIGLEYFRAALWAQVAMFAVGLLTALLWIPDYGLYGAIYSIAAAHCAFLISSVVVSGVSVHRVYH